MASSVSAGLLKQLSAASQNLNSASDQLNQELKTIEDALASYNLGVCAWVKSRDTYEEGFNSKGEPYLLSKVEMLGYDKMNGKWGLFICAGNEELEPNDATHWPLRDAPRQMRVAAIDAIPQLLEMLIARASELATRVETKTAEARAIAGSIKKPKKGQ